MPAPSIVPATVPDPDAMVYHDPKTVKVLWRSEVEHLNDGRAFAIVAARIAGGPVKILSEIHSPARARAIAGWQRFGASDPVAAALHAAALSGEEGA